MNQRLQLFKQIKAVQGLYQVQVEAGSALGLANVGAATLGATTSFVIPGVPAGTYYVRVRAITSAGSGAPSSDVVVVVP